MAKVNSESPYLDTRKLHEKAFTVFVKSLVFFAGSLKLAAVCTIDYSS